jgi:putative DNA primase/helicase
VLCSELQEGRKLNEAKVKDLTGGDTLVARPLYREFFEFKPTHKLWISGNHKPVITGVDEGIWRRIKLIPFSITIPENERRPMAELLREFEGELPGILNWAVEGNRQYKLLGLSAPEVVLKASIDYRDEMDILNTFLTECCVQNSTSHVTNKELYKVYQRWCEDNTERPLPSRQFPNRVKERGYKLEAGSGNTRVWRGLGLLHTLEGELT